MKFSVVTLICLAGIVAGVVEASGCSSLHCQGIYGCTLPSGYCSTNSETIKRQLEMSNQNLVRVDSQYISALRGRLGISIDYTFQDQNVTENDLVTSQNKIFMEKFGYSDINNNSYCQCIN